MIRTLRHFLTLSCVTLRELASQPVCVLLTVFSSVLIGLVPLALFFNFGEDGKLARDGALAFHLLLGLAVAVTAASASVGTELNRGTAATLLSKPVSRTLFLLSKYTGVVLLVALFSISATLSALMAERISEAMVYTDTFSGRTSDAGTAIRLLSANAIALIWGAWRHWKHGRFGPAVLFSQPLLLLAALLIGGLFTRVGEWHPYALQLDTRLLPASLLVFFALLTLSAIATALSTRLRLGPTISVAVAVLFLGLMLDAFIPRQGAFPLILRTLVPNWQHFWKCDVLTNGGVIPLRQVVDAAIYAVTYTAAVLTLGSSLLRQRDVS